MSIIGNAITAGGAKKIAVTFSGVGSETVSWTGTESGSTTLTNGSGSAVLKEGAYSFTFSKSSGITGAIAANIDADHTAVKAWGSRTPAFWFGRTFGYTTGSSGSPTVSTGTDYISMSDLNASRRTYYWNSVPKGSHTMAKAYVDTTGSYNSQDSTAKVTGSHVTSQTGQTGGKSGVLLTGNVSADTSLGVSYTPSSSSVAGGIKLYAIWLE